MKRRLLPLTAIVTNIWKNTIDSDRPTSSVTQFASTTVGAEFEVNWSGSDVGSGVAFNQSEFDEAIKLLKGKAIDTANAIWVQVKDQIGDNETATSKTFYGVSLKCTYAVRATAMVEGTAVQSAVAKIAVTPLKYPAPAKVTQSVPGMMSFTWEAPNLKNNKLPDVVATEVTSITYTIGLYDTKQKKFTGTIATTLIEGLEGLTTDLLTGVAKDNVIAVQQVITFANGLEVKSAVKTLKIK